MTKKYSLANTTWDQAEFNAIQRVIQSEMFTMGKFVLEFETQFAATFNKKYAVMVNSGSSANLLMIAALRYSNNYSLNAGDEIIVPAVSWSTTYMPLQQYNLKLKFVDIDLNTLNYDLAALQKAVSEKTKAVFAVNLLGNPNNFTEIEKITSGKNIILLEDNCESMGAVFNGMPAGSFGLMGSFSSFFSHHISTMEGGMIITDDEELYHIMLALRAHGWTRNLPKINKVSGVKSNNSFEESFKFVLPGYNVRPLELSGAIGIEQLKKLPAIVEKRRQNAARFIELIKPFDWLLHQEETGQSSWFGFSLVIRPESDVSRQQLIDALETFNIEYRPIVAGNFLKNPVIQYFDYSIAGHIVNADVIDSKGLFIGNHHYDLSDEFELLKNALLSVC